MVSEKSQQGFLCEIWSPTKSREDVREMRTGQSSLQYIDRLGLRVLPALLLYSVSGPLEHALRDIPAGQPPVPFDTVVQFMVKDAGDNSSTTSIIEDHQRLVRVGLGVVNQPALLDQRPSKGAGDPFAGLVLIDKGVALENILPLLV